MRVQEGSPRAEPQRLRRLLLALVQLGALLGLAAVFWLNRQERPASFAERRAGLRTKVIRDPRGIAHEPPQPPPAGSFERVQYPSSLGPLWAYVSVPTPGAAPGPAIVWATGGFSNSIDADGLTAGPPDNDQSAAAFPEAGIVLVKPSFRGGNDNPGRYEELYGEVDDLLAALAYTRRLPYVDPARVYLGGHSTGGTLVLLAAELSDNFRAAFAFGPVESARSYGENLAPFDPVGLAAVAEWELRSPIVFLAELRRPAFVFEGERGNADCVWRLAQAAQDSRAPLRTFLLPWGDHFSILRPLTERVAQKILADTGESVSLRFGPEDLVAP